MSGPDPRALEVQRQEGELAARAAAMARVPAPLRRDARDLPSFIGVKQLEPDRRRAMAKRMLEHGGAGIVIGVGGEMALELAEVIDLLRDHALDWGACDADRCECSHARAVRLLADFGIELDPLERVAAEPEPVYIEEGWWHYSVNAGKVHDHTSRQPATMHRLCEPIYTKRAARSTNPEGTDQP